MVRTKRLTRSAPAVLAAPGYWRKMLKVRPAALIGYWPLWEAAGGTADDLSVQGNNGAYTGVVLGEAGVGDGKTCPLFDGAADFCNLYSAGFAADFSGSAGTLAAWVKVRDAGVWADAANRYVFHFAANTTTNYIRMLKTSTANQLAFTRTANGDSKTLLLLAGDTDWMHLAMTWDASAGPEGELKAYINGVKVGATMTGLQAWSGALASVNALIGARNTTPSSVWSGWIAHAAVWNVALTAQEIARLARPFDSLHPEYARATNASGFLSLPSSDGQGQGTHPDVYYHPAGWHGYPYWMAYTPYTGGDLNLENPEIIASQDGETWEVPEGLTNPIDPDPADPVYNSDPCLVLGQDGILYCFYRDYNATTYVERLVLRASVDGVTWGPETEVIASGLGKSPSIIWDGAQYVLWAVYSSAPRKISRRTAAAPGGPWSVAQDCTMNLPPGKEPWHLSVYRDGNLFIGLITMVDMGAVEYDSARLYVALSNDGMIWDVAESPVLDVVAGSWDDERIYRSSIAPRPAGGYDLFYSARRNLNGVWRIGKTVLTL